MRMFTRTCAISLLFFAWSSAEELTPELEQLVSKRNEAVAKIDRTMVDELEKLKLRYTKAGNLEAANKTVKLIAQYSDKLSEPPSGDADSSGPEARFSGVFVSENGTVFTMKFDGGTSKASVKQLGSDGQNPEVATAWLQDDRLEITYKKNGPKATMVHVDGNRFHWFWGGNLQKKPVLMTKRAADTDK